MLADLGHPFADGEPQYDITFENVQAGERTSHLFRLANFHGGIVVGTGDLSELALGWCTYGVGDHMSHYNVNASVPKTLIKHLVRWVADNGQVGEAGSARAAGDPGDRGQPRAGADGERRRRRRAAGPEDRGHHRALRAAGLPPLLHAALRLPAAARWPSSPTRPGTTAPRGRWPDDIAGPSATPTRWPTSRGTWAPSSSASSRPASSSASACPTGPRSGSGGSLSPRGDWRAPSDGEAAVWLDDLAHIPDDEG